MSGLAVPNLPQSFHDEDTSPPSSISRPTKDAHGRTLNPRSCVTCRRRKVKCDKLHPCANCSRAHIECIFPAPGRAPRRLKKPGESRDKELLDRLRRLEGVVKGLGVDVQNENEEDTSPIANGGRQDASQPHLPTDQSRRQEPRSDESVVEPWLEESPSHVDTAGQDFEQQFGRLVVDHGRSRYINLSFWANLSNEVEDIKSILARSSDEDEGFEGSPPTESPMAAAHAPNEGWMFGFSSQHVDMLSLHPMPYQIPLYWNIFKDRIDPVVKVLHVPTIEKDILHAASNLAYVPKGLEALLFAIYYAAATSLSNADCLSQLGEERSVLLTRYRFAMEQALARARFLVTEEIIVLQAFVIFLLCLRRNSDARVIWTLTGVLLRIAQTIGIHRDGTHFGLAPLEIELRRRLWWQICLIDIRASEDHGCDPTIMEHSFDTHMPLNIYDTDLDFDTKEFPSEREGCTEMTFSLIRFEVFRIQRRIYHVPSGSTHAGNEQRKATLQDKEKWIAECHQRLEQRYLKNCDIRVPLHWVTATVARLIMSKMWLTIYHPFHRQDGCKSLDPEIREKLFITSLENIEYVNLLETEARTIKWGWLFKTYMHWYVFAFMLSELCHRTKGELVDRAWVAVEKARVGRWDNDNENIRAGHLWRPLKKLYRKAQESRQRGLAEESMFMETDASFTDGFYNPTDRPAGSQASLSDAQLQRLRQRPAFSHVPGSKPDTVVSISSTARDGPPINTPDNGVEPLHSRGSVPHGGQIPNQSGFASANSVCQNGELNFGSNVVELTGPVNYGSSNLVPSENLQFDDAEQTCMGVAGNAIKIPERTNSDDSTVYDTTDYTLMDTSGQVNWANWDQLVRQLGMEVDSTGNTSGEDWVGTEWDPSLSSAPRMGMGMGGDWF